MLTQALLKVNNTDCTQMNGALTQHPEEPTQQADDQQLPYLLQALLRRRQQAAMGKLLEKLLSAKGPHHHTCKKT